MKQFSSKLLKYSLLFLGWVSLGLGLIGAFVPLLPTTPFLLLSAWCFFKSSKKAYDWLYSKPLIKKTLDQWKQKGAIPKDAKLIGALFISVSIISILYKVDIVWIQISVCTFLLGVMVFILTRPS